MANIDKYGNKDADQNVPEMIIAILNINSSFSIAVRVPSHVHGTTEWISY